MRTHVHTLVLVQAAAAPGEEEISETLSCAGAILVPPSLDARAALTASTISVTAE